MKHINILRNVVLALPAVLALSACDRTSPAASETKHDADDPTRNTNAWNWVATTDAQYKAVIAPLVQVDTSTILPTNHALVKRVQLWLDKVDAQLRADYPSQLAGVPKPQARVVVDANANAFVAPAPVCYKAAIKVGTGAVTTASTRERVFVDVSTGALSDFPDDLDCLSAGTSTAGLAAFVAEFNAASTACKFQLQGAKLLPNAACKIDDTIAGTTAGRSVVILQTANWVTVHTGIIPMMGEDAFVAVVSHELGHYYRSHITAHESNYGFYYTLDEQNPDHRPVADMSVKAAGEAAFAAAGLLSSNDVFQPIAGQKLRSELFIPAGSLVRKAGSSPGAPAECVKAADFLKSTAFTSAIGKYPFSTPTAATADAEKAFEAQTRPCLAKLKVLGNGAEIGASGASYLAFRDLITSPVFPSWLLTLPASTRTALQAEFDKVDKRLAADVAVGLSFDRVLDAVSRELDSQEAHGAVALRRAHEDHIGQYTIEQEADEESAEWIAKLGFDPHAAVDAMDALVKGEATSLNGLSLGQGDCEALAARDWTDAAGAYQFVPVGNYAEIHHSTCYRMFNLTREIAAHREESSGADLPAHGGQGWADLQKVASDLGAETPLRRRGPLSLVARKSHVFECVYAPAPAAFR